MSRKPTRPSLIPPGRRRRGAPSRQDMAHLVFWVGIVGLMILAIAAATQRPGEHSIVRTGKPSIVCHLSEDC